MSKIKYSVGSIVFNDKNDEFKILERLPCEKVVIQSLENEKILTVGTSAISSGKFSKRILKYNVGDVNTNKYGDKYKIIEKNGDKYIIKFLIDGSIKQAQQSRLDKGNVIRESTNIHLEIGDLIKTNTNDIVKIVSICNRKYKIQYQDLNEYVTWVNRNNLINGNIKNPFAKSVHGVGFIGYDVDCEEKLRQKFMSIWRNLIAKGYSEYYKSKKICYKDILICDEWLSFSNFLKWCIDTYIEDFELDKDLLQFGIKNKIYSPNTCVWLPRNINGYLSRFKESTKADDVGIIKTAKGYTVLIKKFLIEGFTRITNIEDKITAKNIYSEEKNKDIDRIKEYMYSLNLWESYVIEKLDLFKDYYKCKDELIIHG